jgi:hypothetical protein
MGHTQPASPLIGVEGFAELIAQKVKEKLAEEFRIAKAAAPARPEPAKLLTVKELASRIGMSPRFVYNHQEELAVIRMGTGPKPPLRFDSDRSVARFAELREQGTVKISPKVERRELPTGAPLLPVRGRAA